MGKIVQLDSRPTERACATEDLYYVALAQHIIEFDSVVARLRTVGLPEPTYEEYCRVLPPPSRPERLRRPSELLRFSRSKAHRVARRRSSRGEPR